MMRDIKYFCNFVQHQTMTNQNYVNLSKR